MSIDSNYLPKYHETFTPILSVLEDGRIVHYNELKKLVRDEYFPNLSPDLFAQTTKDGEPLILNRIGWGKVYLKQAGMLQQPARAMVQITDKGKRALHTGKISLQDVIKDPEFLAHQAQVDTRKTKNETSLEEQTPQDMIDSGVQAIENDVKVELLDKLKSSDPYYFERVVNDLFERMGYGGAETTVKSGDGGIDGIINQDELGLEKIYIQAKRYDGHNVREPDIRNFIGAMSSDVSKGIFVTTSFFDEKAKEKARMAHHKLILIDGIKLVDLMYQFNVGVQAANTYVVKSVDEDYFL